MNYSLLFGLCILLILLSSSDSQWLRYATRRDEPSSEPRIASVNTSNKPLRRRSGSLSITESRPAPTVSRSSQIEREDSLVDDRPSIRSFIRSRPALSDSYRRFTSSSSSSPSSSSIGNSNNRPYVSSVRRQLIRPSHAREWSSTSFPSSSPSEGASSSSLSSPTGDNSFVSSPKRIRQPNFFGYPIYTSSTSRSSSSSNISNNRRILRPSNTNNKKFNRLNDGLSSSRTDNSPPELIEREDDPPTITLDSNTEGRIITDPKKRILKLKEVSSSSSSRTSSSLRTSDSDVRIPPGARPYGNDMLHYPEPTYEEDEDDFESSNNMPLGSNRNKLKYDPNSEFVIIKR